MNSCRLWFGALMALALAMPALAGDRAFADALRRERSRPASPRFERAAFLVRPSVTAVSLSPDGRQMAWLRGPEDGRSLWLAPTDAGEARQVLAGSDATDLLWSHDGRWLLLVSPRHLFALATAGQAGTRTLVELSGPGGREVMEVDATSPAAVIVRERVLDADGAPGGWRLSRVRVDGQQERLADAVGRITGFALADDGRLGWLQQVDGAGVDTLRIDRDGHRERVLRCDAMWRCALWPVLDADARALFMSDIGGSLRRLQRLEPDGSMRPLAGDPAQVADVDEATADPATGRPTILAYRGIAWAAQGLDPATQARVDRIRARFPGKALRFQRGAHRWLVVERGGAQQDARYHLFDPAHDRFTEVLTTPPLRGRDGGVASWLPDASMATQLPFDWTASDGMRLHGFVRVPPGADPATLPLVALVHGGPWGNVAADEFGTGVSQFLVNRGYAVFEPNFRGSTGFGRDYMLAAQGDFGNGRVQRDIVEGVRALLAAGVGDSRRVGIVGASFGGYSALLGVTWQPELFRVGVALVPPSDFAWDIAWITRSTEANSLSSPLPFELWMTQVGLGDRGTLQRMHDESPLANATRMRRPLTIIAGGDDQRVALRGVLGYAAQLKHLDRDVTLLVDPAAGHSNERPLAREASLYLIADALHRHLGGMAETPPDPAMRDYLAANLRLSGDALTTASSASPVTSPSDVR
ncbi:Dipeptidyl aminopeptidase/acylaminoacyl peptidase [Luteibacter sp. 22Crub2.1]|nr:Dipeptidyl aminopeptidase/acylaminoacyl peptidase [Luteibacter sp. 22Crub2.1]